MILPFGGHRNEVSSEVGNRGAFFMPGRVKLSNSRYFLDFPELMYYTLSMRYTLYSMWQAASLRFAHEFIGENSSFRFFLGKRQDVSTRIPCNNISASMLSGLCGYTLPVIYTLQLGRSAHGTGKRTIPDPYPLVNLR
jgi:hypothetical protein